MMTFTRRNAFAAAAGLAASLLMSASALAADIKPYSQAAFDKAVAAGNPVVVRFYESWCTNCAAQDRALKKLYGNDARFADFTQLDAVFSQNRALAREFGINRRTSLVVFKNGKPAGSATGVTRANQVADVLAKAL